MKILNKIFLPVLALLLFFNSSAFAASTAPQKSIEYLDNGDYIETTITVSSNLTRSSSCGGRKTSTYKNSAGVAMWSVTVTASFSYTPGVSSKCTSASGSTADYSSLWEVSSATASKSGNHATATATGKLYSGSSLVGSYTRSVTLSCDTYGNLS